jgi:RNA polymerase sigma-70 factor, ECF subfamily
VDREEILARLRERIVAFAASRISRDIAEDLAQEVLMLLHEKYAQVTRVEELLPLSIRILRFKMTALHRKAARRGEYGSVSVDEVQVPDLTPDPSAYVEQKLMLERLRKAMGGLCARCQELFRLKLEGKSFSEIQKLMGAGSINTVYTWDLRCRNELRELMGGTGEEGER